MSEQGFAGWIADHREQETASERAWRLARQAEQRDDRAAEHAEAERAATVEERHELMQLARFHAGITGRSVGDLAADASRAADEDDQYAEAQRTIERIDKRREARRQQMAEQAQRMAEVTSLASRSATATGNPDLLAPAKQAHREFVAATRAMQAEAAAGTTRQARRPFPARRGAGQAVRSELECWHCVSNNVSHEESVLLHLDPRFNVPITTLEQAIAEEQADHAERRRYSGRAEISR